MSATIGVGIGATSVRAVVVKRGVVTWHDEVATDGGGGVVTALAALLARAPRPRLRRARVVAAIGPALSQTKQLSGLQPVRKAALLDRLVRESAGRFFMRHGSPLATTRAYRGEDGAVWCAATDASLLDEIGATCVTLRLRFYGALPGALAAARGLAGDSYTWPDGDIAVEVVTRGGAPVIVRRRRADPTDSAPTASDALAPLGDDAWRLADAFGAAVATKHSPLVWSPRVREAHRTAAWLRPGLAACVVALAALSLTAGGLRSRIETRRAVTRLAGAQATIREMARLDHDLAAATSAIARIERFAADRRSFARLLSELTQALPESTAIVSLRADTASGTLVTLSRRAADLVPQLREVSAIQTSQVTGPAMRETQGGVALERATIRFTFVRQRGAPTSTGAAR